MKEILLSIFGSLFGLIVLYEMFNTVQARKSTTKSDRTFLLCMIALVGAVIATLHYNWSGEAYSLAVGVPVGAWVGGKWANKKADNV